MQGGQKFATQISPLINFIWICLTQGFDHVNVIKELNYMKLSKLVSLMIQWSNLNQEILSSNLGQSKAKITQNNTSMELLLRAISGTIVKDEETEQISRALKWQRVLERPKPLTGNLVVDCRKGPYKNDLYSFNISCFHI